MHWTQKLEQNKKNEQNMQYFMTIFNKKEYYRKLEILAQEWNPYYMNCLKKNWHYNALSLNPGASYLEVTKTLKVSLW